MSRAALRKPQHDLFAPGPAAHAVPQTPVRTNERFLHFCEAPGCDAWGSFGVGVFQGAPGAWFCGEHRP